MELLAGSGELGVGGLDHFRVMGQSKTFVLLMGRHYPVFVEFGWAFRVACREADDYLAPVRHSVLSALCTLQEGACVVTPAAAKR